MAFKECSTHQERAFWRFLMIQKEPGVVNHLQSSVFLRRQMNIQEYIHSALFKRLNTQGLWWKVLKLYLLKVLPVASWKFGTHQEWPFRRLLVVQIRIDLLELSFRFIWVALIGTCRRNDCTLVQRSRIVNLIPFNHVCLHAQYSWVENEFRRLAVQD